MSWLMHTNGYLFNIESYSLNTLPFWEIGEWEYINIKYVGSEASYNPNLYSWIVCIYFIYLDKL